MAQNLNFNLSVDTNSAVSSINQFFSAFDQGSAKAKTQLNQAFGQTLQTNVEIQLKNGELVAKKVQDINQESKRLETAAKAINKEWGKTPAELKRQLASLKQLQGNTRKFSSDTGKITSDWRLVTQRIREAQAELNKMTKGTGLKRLQAELQGVIGKFTLVQTLANLATSAIQGIAQGAGAFANMAGRMEVLNLQLEAFTGGASEARDTFNEFIDIAAKSPFNLEQVANAGKIMLAFGVETETAIEATEDLAIAAAATGGDINLLARNLGQVAAQGQAYTRDLTQFAIQGIPIWDQMSQVTGKTVTELKAMAAEGQISFGIVNAALKNLTAEGTAFAQVAERMQETFQGRMARIEASINNLALAFVKTFNQVDKALGGIVSGSMKLFADGIDWIAKNMNTLAQLFVVATAAATAFFVVQNFGAIVSGLGMVLNLVKSYLTIQNLLNAAQIVFHALMGNWAGIAAAIGAGTAAYFGFKAAQEKVIQDELEVQAQLGETAVKVGEVTDAQKELAIQSGVTTDKQIEDYDRLKEKMDEKKEALDQEVAALEGMKEQISARYDAEIEDIQAVIDKNQEKIDNLKDQHSEELARITERHDAAIDALDVEIGKLREKTTEEQALYDFQKKQLIEKIASGKLDQAALLSAKARLSRMERQEEIQKLVNKKKQIEAEKEKEIEDTKIRQEAAIQNIIDQNNTLIGKIDDIATARDNEITEIENTIDAAKGITTEVNITTDAVNAQIAIVKNLTAEYSRAADQAERAAKAIRDAAKAKADAAPSNTTTTTTTSGARFAGGPVSGGSTYTVNELGREAFLSASGKLSMIKAPSFGSWKAPSSGTVIPAHLTKRLDIPTGGVNLNRAPAANAARESGSNMGGMIKAIRGAMGGGDTFNQNVTVQSANPTQTANNMMVEMTRLRRRRLG